MLKIEDEIEQSFYEKQTLLDNWSVRELKRQKKPPSSFGWHHRGIKQDIGRMNMYLGYFEEEESTEGDNPPIGIVLAREKDELLNQICFAWYQHPAICKQVPAVSSQPGRTAGGSGADL